MSEGLQVQAVGAHTAVVLRIQSLTCQTHKLSLPANNARDVMPNLGQLKQYLEPPFPVSLWNIYI